MYLESICCQLMINDMNFSLLRDIFSSLFLEMRLELSTGAGLATSTARATIHQEITTLKRKRKEGSVLYYFQSQ